MKWNRNIYRYKNGYEINALSNSLFTFKIQAKFNNLNYYNIRENGFKKHMDEMKIKKIYNMS